MAYYTSVGFLVICGYLLQWIPDTTAGFPWLAGWFCLQGILLTLFMKFFKERKLSLQELIAIFLISRLPLLSSIPIMENDFWRYLWDGRVLASGFNPYRYPPLAQELDVIHLWIRDRVGYGDIGTIYPPFAQLVFALTNFLAEESLIALKLIFLSFEGMAILGIWRWLKKHERGQEILWLVFHPLFLKEIVNSAHLDSLAVGTSVMFITSLQKSWWRPSIWLGLSVLSKLWPMVLLPILFFKLPNHRRWHALMLFFSVVILFYVPFLGAWSFMWDGTKAFADYWIFNPGFHSALVFFLEEGTAKIVSAFIVILVSTYAAFTLPIERAAVWSIGSLILLSPVINAWYVLWILPFALMARAWPWIVFGVVVVAGYSWFWDKDWALWIRSFQWLAFGVSTLIFLKKKYQEDGGLRA